MAKQSGNTLDNLQELRAFAECAPHLQLVVGAKALEAGDLPQVQHVNIAGDAKTFFREAILAALQGYCSDAYIPRRYDPGYKPEGHEICCLDCTDEDRVRAIVELVEAGDCLEVFRQEEGIIQRLRFYAVVLQDNKGRAATFFGSFGPRRELSRSGLLLMFGGGQYDRVREKVFQFDGDVACFSWDSRMFICRMERFHTIFEFFEQLRERSDEIISAVVDKVPLHNVNEFKTACSRDYRMMSKLANIYRRPYFGKMKLADIERTIAEFDLDVKLVRQNGHKALVFEGDTSHRWQILKLLDDDYLGSFMTSEKYEVNSKSNVAGRRR